MVIILLSIISFNPAIITIEEHNFVTPAALGISLMIDFENGTVLNFSGLNGTNVLNVTRSVVDVEVQWSGNLAFVTSIGGLRQEQNHWWQYWVNNQYASVASNMYILIDGDSIEWRRTSSSSGSSNSDTQTADITLVIGGITIAVIGIGFLLILHWRMSRRYM